MSEVEERGLRQMFEFPTVNFELLEMARANLQRSAGSAGGEKRAFVPGGDPVMTGSAGMPPGMPPGMDPAMLGMPPGMPPGMDPAMLGMPPGMPSGMPSGMDPAMLAMPPGMDPAMLAGGGGAPPAVDPLAGLQPMIDQAVQAAMQGRGGGGGGGGGSGGGASTKVKIDQNVTLLQILKILARLADAMGVQIPAGDMVVTSEDLRTMSQGGSKPGGEQPRGGGSAIPPIEPVQAAAPGMGGGGKTAADRYWEQGTAFDAPFARLADKARAILQIQGRK